MSGPTGGVRFMAHRGASRQYAEHTRAAYVQAIAEGADGLECDVQLTADGQVVLWHDATLERTSDGTGDLHDVTLAQLRGLDVFSWRNADLPATHGTAADQVLTLDELIDLVADAGRPLDLVIEIKHPSPFGMELEDRVLEVLTARGWTPEDGTVAGAPVWFMSFFPASQQHLAKTVPAERLMFLVDVLDEAKLSEGTEPVADGGFDFTDMLRALVAQGLQMVADGVMGGVGPSLQYVKEHPEQVRAWADAGRLVRVWTVDEPDDARVCLAAGAHELTTNVPGELRAALGA
ncbi:glycerophosphoryl diester phosphodiesterase [Flavimobilis marinus]|uniref:Glycerophosphoryl diester phosphodiesterase n=1 Tax=Flavimobilis marinus TaxID=285351 RepID=A0A1I2C9L7_9MICO|nr:glycerophosphodiester phosphodiesterase family protein [Flavimobilis marinus]GHG48192.1 glycerophosphoryl diester phosphodiesterase [Flavimobilis marinus]SFE64872.1 glycerophosphoryl diester phosphodiesterase [Flavimobilis marinus]